jgi:ATP-binding cassette, subfamily B (MDR/TAP), member 1
LIHLGISEKVAVAVSFLGAFFTGFILAYAKNWRLALAMSSMLPCIAITGGVMNKFVSKYMQYVYFLEVFVNCEFNQSQALT